jgi:hypothetical protein
MDTAERTAAQSAATQSAAAQALKLALLRLAKTMQSGEFNLTEEVCLSVMANLADDGYCIARIQQRHPMQGLEGLSDE